MIMSEKMKMNSRKCLALIVCILALFCFGLCKWFTPEPVMFTYEFAPESSAESKIMAIEQVENIIYEINPPKPEIVSEPSPDWGIKMYFSEDVPYSLYFYASRSKDIDPFPNREQERKSVMINGRELEWEIFDGYVIGSYLMDDGYGIILQMEEDLWNRNQQMIIRLIKSAKVY